MTTTYLDDVETSIREQGVESAEITLAFTDGSRNRTYDGEPTWRRGKLAARILPTAREKHSVIQWLDGSNVDHSSKIAEKDTPLIVAKQIIATLRRGY